MLINERTSAGTRCRGRAAAASLLVAALGLSACVDSSRDEAIPSPTPGGNDSPSQPSTPSDDEGFDVGALLTNVTDAIIIPNYTNLASAATGFAADGGSLDVYCAAIDGADEAARLADAQTDWRSLMTQVQLSELHALGPAADNGGALRNRVTSYAEDVVSTCGVDQSVVLAEGPDFDLQSRSINQRGMGALDYLLFNTNLDHTCAPQVPTTQDWDARPDAERKTARCELAKQIASDVADAANAISTAWSPSGGDYRATFLDADDAGNSLQTLTDAIFYIEDGGKDRKLGVPTGINDACSMTSCPELAESRFSGTSLANVRVNLESFIDLFNGATGLGFDDVINDAGFPEVTTRFQDNVAATIAAIDATTVSLFDEVSGITTAQDEANCMNSFGSPDTATDLPSCALVGLMKRITDDLRIEFVMIVNVELPERVQSDND
ncbi:MAG: imelysin family protein [Pseudomonadota bacterium]